jgi:hypothetical protein
LLGGIEMTETKTLIEESWKEITGNYPDYDGPYAWDFENFRMGFETALQKITGLKDD